MLRFVSESDTFGIMRLDEYLSKHGIPGAEFAKRIGVSRITVHRLRKGERTPKKVLAQKILSETEGLVTPNDFFDVQTTAIT